MKLRYTDVAFLARLLFPALALSLVIVLVTASFASGTITIAGADNSMPEAKEALPQQALGDAQVSAECSTIWHPVDHPDVGNLSEVHALSPTDVYAAGSQGLLHWDGIAWSIVYTETYPPFNTIAGLSSDDVWFVGGSRIVHWDGSTWTKYDAPTYYMNLRAIAVGAPDRAWAVGGSNFSGTTTPDIAYWDGDSWRTIFLSASNPVYAPEGGGCEPYSVLTGAVAVSPNEMWAVGSAGSDYPCATSYPITVHCINDTCRMVPAIVANQRMERAGQNDFWTVGGSGAQSIAHFVNGAWVYVAHPDIGNLYDVSGSAPDDAWAVGENGFLHYDGNAWSKFPMDTGANRVTAASITAAWAISGTDTLLRYEPLGFTDVSASNPFFPYIQCLACKDVISGFGDGTFRPADHVTRGQLSKIVANAAGFSEQSSGQGFEDVAINSTYWAYVERLASRGMIGGYDCGTRPSEPCGPDELPYFRPGNHATREQTAKIVSNAAGFADQPAAQIFEDVHPGNPFYAWVQRLASRGIVSGYPCGGAGESCGPDNLPYFRPTDKVSRGQTTKLVSNTFYPGCQTPSEEMKK